MQSFLWKIYLYTFVDAFMLIGAIFALYFTAHGLNPFQISILIAIWSAVVFLGEVPAGVIADKYPRRNLLVIAALMRGIGLLVWLLFPNFFGFAIGFVFWGLRNILTSGTFEAFVYDELKTAGKEEQYEKVTGKTTGYSYLGLMLSTVLGGIMAQNNFPLVIIASVIASILSALVLFSIKSVKPLKSTDEIHSLSILKNAITQVMQTKRLLILITFICLVIGTYVAVDDFWPLVFSNYGYTITEVGALIAIVYGVAAIAGYTAHLLNDKKKQRYLLPSIILGGLIYLSVGLLKLPVLLPLLFIAVYVLKVCDIKFEAILQHSIASEQRATISSIKSLMVEVVYMSLILLFGIVGTQLGLSTVLIIAGMLLMGVALIYWRTLVSLISMKD